ncbi:hypothetical protein ACLB2K_051579 [Fragaria x ananassa]
MAATATPTQENDEKTLQEELSLPILLADRVLKSAHEAESSKPECSDLAQQVDRLSHMLRSAVRISAASPSLYERPVRRIAADVTKNLDRALTLVRKCRHSGVLRQVFSITTAADFRKVSNLLESSIGDMKWLLSVFESDGANLSLPPIASNDPILSWVWSYIATIQMGQLRDRVEAASSLVSLARDNDRNKKIIVDEGGVTPLLKLLKEGSSPEAQVAAANALFHLATDRERVRIVIDLNGIPMIVSVLGDSPMRVQAAVVRLVAEMAELDPIAQEEFARENVTRPLVSLLAMDTVLDEPKLQFGKPSIHSLVISKELVGKGANSSSRLGSFSSNHYSSDGSSRGGLHYRKEREREVESAEVKLKLKVGCAEALWKLCRDSAVAESNPELRRSAFKPNSPAAKAVVDQLMRVIQEESNPDLQLPAIKAIGSLARTFAARETRIVGPLVARLGNENVDVATEATIALGKFVCLENFNRVEHSKTIIEFDGVPSLMRLLKATDRINEVAHMHCLVLLCYLALHVGNSKALEQAQVLSTLEGGARSAVAQNPDLKELFSRAIHHLSLYQPGAHPHRQTYMP